MNSFESTIVHTDSSSPALTILHTNDFHNHLTDVQADKLKILRKSLGNRGLLLDSGDAVGSGNITFLPGGEPILDKMSDAGYDAMTVGNREFHFSALGFRAKLSRAKFPILCANIILNKPLSESVLFGDDRSENMPVTRFKIFDTQAGSVLVFGLTVPMITAKMAVRKVSAYLFEEPVRFASTYVPLLIDKYHPAIVIALTHIGIKQDRLLAESVAGIDIIISGHTHVVLEEGERVGDSLIVQTGCFGKSYGIVEIYSDSSSVSGHRYCARLEAL